MKYQFLPNLTLDEYEALKTDIAKRGVMVPIEYDENGELLDGHHRRAICQELRIECPSVTRIGMTEDQKIEHVLNLNLSRRHLGRQERADLHLALKNRGMSYPQIARMTGASVGTIHGDVQAFNPESLPPTVGSDGKTYSPTIAPRDVYEALVAQHPDPDERIAYVQEQRRQGRAIDPLTGWMLEAFERVKAGETIVASYRVHEPLIVAAEAADLFVRIDRRSDWGNPFELPGDGDRHTVIANYRDHYLPFKPSLLARLSELRGKVLGCWCAPDACHGDILVEALR